MKVPRRERPSGVGFDITPLIDVVFLLMIFFLVTAHFAQNEQVEAVELPVVSEVSDESELPRRSVVTVTSDGTIFMKGRNMSIGEFEIALRENTHGRSADYEVRIRSDRSVPYERVEPLLLASLRAGVTKIGFAVTEK